MSLDEPLRLGDAIVIRALDQRYYLTEHDDNLCQWEAIGFAGFRRYLGKVIIRDEFIVGAADGVIEIEKASADDDNG